MGKCIALLSGKGGSGKTTLALSMASLLSRANIKTLLVDCDFSTNGATYFYEDKLTPQKKQFSFLGFLIDDVPTDANIISVSECLDFIPSVASVSNAALSNCRYDENDFIRIQTFKSEICEQYEIIIFDCQAGYTDLLKYLLPNVDETLFVMEADAISSASMRTLHLKIGALLNTRKAYQVFNKATDEEFEIYNRISGGTIFTNIETVLFDWKIRKAFALSEIPDMERTSARYGEQVYGICKILLRDSEFQSKLAKFSSVLEYYKAIDEREHLMAVMKEKDLERLTFKNAKYKRLSVFLSLSSIIMISIAIISLIDKKLTFFQNEFFVSFIAVGILIASMISFIISTVVAPQMSSAVRKNYDKTLYQKKLNEISARINELEHQDNELLSSRLK